MDDPRPPGNDKDAEVAAAEWLFEDPPTQEPARPPSPVIAPTVGETFELVDVPDQAETAADAATPDPPARAPAMVPPKAGVVRTGAPVVTPRARPTLDDGPKVEQVWSRTAEWGPTLVVLFCWAAAVLGVLYLSFSWELYELAAMIFIAGCLVGVVLSYPILITLERPVRMTPEQAARDYFGALSHHLPHHRRMWLLLSSRGKVCTHFASYEGFRNYWISRISQLREGHAGPISPLVFVVEDFRAEKSAGKTEIDASYKVRVFVRGKRKDGPIFSVPVEQTLARGPDGMWYLDDGTLAERPPRTRAME
jgi:hypothetical protein